MSTTDDVAPLIYGLEFQARALVAEKAESEVTRFMVGTQTLKMASNQIHIVELNDETGALYSQVYSHGCGEIWHLDWSKYDNRLVLSTYQTLVGESLAMETSLWTLDGSAGEDDTKQPVLHKEATIVPSQEHGSLKTAVFHPNDKSKLATAAQNRLTIWDFGEGAPKQFLSFPPHTKGQQHGVELSGAKWSPEEGVSQLAAMQGTGVVGLDPRHGTSPVWHLDNCHSYLVRDVDYNWNRSSVVVSCGDDGGVKYWDVRATNGPLAAFTPHSHWATAVRINTTHDQLVLSSSTDCTVCLSACSSAASDPVLSESTDLGDSTIKVYDHHEDSVVAVEWSSVDPWTFASLSHDGRLLTSTVPNSLKYKILGI